MGERNGTELSRDRAEKSIPGGRSCLACGYDLQGLGEEPRCPECGLLNIPEGYRRQVQELVDSGKWFFSSFFGVFRKRPPGWWWSLDRPGDVRRALVRSAVYLSICVIVINLAVFLSGIVGVGRVQENVRLSDISRDGPPAELFIIEGEEYELGVCGLLETSRQINRTEVLPFGSYPSLRSSSRSFLRNPAAFAAFPVAVILSLVAICAWLLPAAAGIWSQIRKGLPSYARPRRTIFAASLYEAHRAIYLAIVVFIALMGDAYVRYSKPASIVSEIIPFSLVLVLPIWGALGWIGPVRSDFTRQLIQSRWQAIRIVCFYAPLLFWLWVGFMVIILTAAR